MRMNVANGDEMTVSPDIVPSLPQDPDETTLDVLDGAMVTLAIYAFNFTHPGRLLGSNSTNKLNSETSLPAASSAKAEDGGMRHTV